jgi:putative chitinase
MKITSDQLRLIAPYCTKVNADKYIDMINATMAKYEIDTPLRVCHFLAQILHESGSLLYVKELSTGDQYEGRADLGNTQPGDGKLFKGRGFIQLTGRGNYIRYGKALGVDLVSNPDLVAIKYPADVAGWFWSVTGLNAIADIDNANLITRKINGGYNGLTQRLAYVAAAKKVLGVK